MTMECLEKCKAADKCQILSLMLLLGVGGLVDDTDKYGSNFFSILN